MSSGQRFEVVTHPSARDLGREVWTRLSPNTTPFLSYEWFDVLEATGAVGAATGWIPVHLTLRLEGEPIAFCPAYIKTHSQGEFVFDHAWAEFYRVHLARNYYPKLVIAVPFTPATGSRAMLASTRNRQAVLQALTRGIAQLADRFELSGAHVLFAPEGESADWESVGWAQRLGLQFHWRNPGYACFDEFLSRFSAKRRHSIRRERRELRAQGLVLRSLSGAELGPEHVDHIYDFYRATVDKFIWGRRYLNRAFFEEIVTRIPNSLHVVFASRGRERPPVAGAFNLIGEGALYGRYWGAREELKFLHFNVCYYRGIEDAIERKLELFEPGAGGQHKLARGFEPTLTYSNHLLVHPSLDEAVKDFLRREAEALRVHVREVSQRGELKAWR